MRTKSRAKVAETRRNSRRSLGPRRSGHLPYQQVAWVPLGLVTRPGFELSPRDTEKLAEINKIIAKP